MADVGRHASVSAQSVSRYFTGSGYLSGEARARIESAIHELGYRHNKLPRNLRNQCTNSVGLLMLGPLNYGNSALLTGLSREARAQGQVLVTSHIELDPGDPVVLSEVCRDIDNFIAIRTDSLIIATPYIHVGQLIDYARGALPVLALSEGAEEHSLGARSDSYSAAREAVRYLLDLGHHRILHLSGPTNRSQAHTRRNAYVDELARAGIRPLQIVKCEEWDAASGASAGATANADHFSAVFAANDELALGFMSALRKRGVEAPRDYSIIGFDDMPESAFFAPALTSVRLNFEQIGETAMKRIVAISRGENPGDSDPVSTELIVRESVRALG